VSSLNLESLQTGLLKLIKDRPSTLTDPYLRDVASADALVLVREISASWKMISLEQYAPLTTSLLQLKGYLGAQLATLIEEPNLSPFHSDLRDRFLSAAARHPDPLVEAVACFERAMVGVADANLESEVVLDWPVDPYPIFGALLAGRQPPEPEPDPHVVIVGPTQADGFRVIGKTA
jgi:hypothetical protein